MSGAVIAGTSPTFDSSFLTLVMISLRNACRVAILQISSLTLIRRICSNRVTLDYCSESAKSWNAPFALRTV
jgi:hypothetical protein